MRLTRRQVLKLAAGTKALPFAARAVDLKIQDGPFEASRESLRQYRCPEWFRDAKLGIWAVWGPEAVPEQGDWYARQMYIEGQRQYKYHVEHYGHPSKFGYKDVIPLWKAEHWDPDRLMQLYKKAGAKYFCVIANHHDNFDCWNSRYHRWNSVNMGPKKDITGLWRKAALEYGLRFGVTEHLSNSFDWFAPAHSADKSGPYTGVPYDGNDPACADLYHDYRDMPADFVQKAQAMGRVAPDRWKLEYFKRIKDLVDQHQPDLLYTDGGIPFDSYGLSLVAHLYNVSGKQHNGRVEAVYCSKIKTDCETGTCALDLERGVVDKIWPDPWQTDTCVGEWYYRSGIKYKSPATVIQMLADIVSKNGNLLLNFPPKPDGTLDGEAERILDEMAQWMAVNSEAIYGTRPWKVFGEGSAQAQGGHFNEGKLRYTADDIRFTQKGNALYVISLGLPEKELTIRSLVGAEIKLVHMLGVRQPLRARRGEQGLVVEIPAQKPCGHAIALRIEGAPTA